MVLANTTSIGMQPTVDETPIPKQALKHYMLVFDAVYTPRMTRLLREAEESRATIVWRCSSDRHMDNMKDLLAYLILAPKELFRKIMSKY